MHSEVKCLKTRVQHFEGDKWTHRFMVLLWYG